ncbi:HEAT SHOCK TRANSCRIPTION FACTOR [Encephalitozoon cuniculi GB-M1]|uniref:Heat shock transcription factor n=1 Tax=Encephalitozoon cuniculi (strain GB-M1) TaxID=284813 RepID=HSF_ENCCU|nr:heat shock transcription factor [Encephalitozoon cuniculi GB-M1]Q8SS62.2 RecName: Full=Heat shock transcription factor; Short=HSTF; AltName: Full=Heat shock factor protein; Short=HSF [Encephalitozoon cuniculi GB-M1]CAD25227.2 HEAT SHOCK TRANSCRIPTION FACTOR [Encephalitozoon cuniculi GB-M1]
MERSSTSFNFDKIPKFIMKLYKATNNEKYKGICWTPDGLKIHIYDRDVFVKETLPLISKTREFGTFVRMLNSYGFVKSKDIEEEDIYYNKNFRKGREDLLGFDDSLRMIKRKKSSDIRMRIGDGSLKEIVEYLYVQNQELYTELSVCKERIERQERALNGLIEILSRVFRTNSQDLGARIKPSGHNPHNEMDFFLGELSGPLKEGCEPASPPLQDKGIPELSFKPGGIPHADSDTKDDNYDPFF